MPPPGVTPLAQEVCSDLIDTISSIATNEQDKYTLRQVAQRLADFGYAGVEGIAAMDFEQEARQMLSPIYGFMDLPFAAYNVAARLVKGGTQNRTCTTC